MIPNKVVDLSTEILSLASSPTIPLTNVETATVIILRAAEQMKLHGQLISEIANWMNKSIEEVNKNKNLDNTLSSIVLLVSGGVENIITAAKFIVELSKEEAENN